MAQKKLASVREIADEYGLPMWQVHHQIRLGIVPLGVFARFGRRILINRQRWEDWVNAGGSSGATAASDANGLRPRD
jgi:hypothetical protein